VHGNLTQFKKTLEMIPLRINTFYLTALCPISVKTGAREVRVLKSTRIIHCAFYSIGHSEFFRFLKRRQTRVLLLSVRSLSMIFGVVRY